MYIDTVKKDEDSAMKGTRAPVKTKPTRKQAAYEYIKEKILSCVYEPGVIMNEQAICDELDLSRTPVRDALSRLEQEGLVNIMPKKGFIVTALKLGDIDRIYEVRMLLEPYALRRYGHKLDRKELERLRELTEEQASGRGQTGNFNYALDDALHDLIMGATDNRYLLDTYENITNLNLRVRVLSGRQVENRLEETFQEHTDIIDACLRQDWEGAAQAMIRHLENARVAAFPFLHGG